MNLRLNLSAAILCLAFLASACGRSTASASGLQGTAGVSSTPLIGELGTPGSPTTTSISLDVRDSDAWLVLPGMTIVSFAVTPQPSSTWPGATTYVGYADLSRVAGFGTTVEIAILVNADQGRVYYTINGVWTPWPDSAQFTWHGPAMPNAAGVSN